MKVEATARIASYLFILFFIFLVCCIAIANPSSAKFFMLSLYSCYCQQQYDKTSPRLWRGAAAEDVDGWGDERVLSDTILLLL